MKEKFDKKKYIDEYNKENYARFDARIKKDLNDKIKNYCERNNLSKAQFIMYGFEELIKKEG